MKKKPFFKFSFNRLVLVVVAIVIGYQLTFTWIPLWEKATRLQGADVSGVQILDQNGRTVLLSEFKGKPLIINFWASWCVPCRIEIPLLNAIYPELLEKDKQLIGVNQSESQQTIDRFQAGRSISFPVYRDRGELSKSLNIQMIPAIAVIDENGKVQSITYGFRPWIQAYLLWWV